MYLVIIRHSLMNLTFLTTSIKKNTSMVSSVKGIIVSVNGLSNENMCSKFSYIKNMQNKENVNDSILQPLKTSFSISGNR